jgi:hypothetical protein
MVVGKIADNGADYSGGIVAGDVIRILQLNLMLAWS